jgi:outer membrane protein OmpA-like peptidoglycan-associated protein
VALPVIVNDARVDLPAIHAQGEYIGDRADFFFLDDEANPLTLKFRIGNGSSAGADADALRLEVVKIAHRCAPGGAVNSPAASRLEQTLTVQGRADVYDLYFDFNSDRIREESEVALNEISDVMHRHPDWKLSIEGHTDGIGADAPNLELSRRRASAVKDTLVSAHGVAAARLSTAGYGKSRPKDTNESLEGRARNRRVELIRQ